jgi:hypothetical protein
MDSPTTTVSPPKPKQPLVARLGFFVLGGVGSSALNKTILAGTQHFLGWPVAAGFALSAGSTAIIFFLWSYFINFRTSLVWKNCIGRYAICFLLALLMTYLIGVCGLQKFGSRGLTGYAVILIVQSFTGGIKFLLYHFWVFPYADGPAPKEPATVAS